MGPFDIEDVVDPIGVKISDAIMNFQNSGYDVTTKVYEDCGTPRIQKRQVLYWHPKSVCIIINGWKSNILLIEIIIIFILGIFS